MRSLSSISQRPPHIRDVLLTVQYVAPPGDPIVMIYQGKELVVATVVENRLRDEEECGGQLVVLPSP